MTTLQLLGLITEALYEATASGFWAGRDNKRRADEHEARWKALRIEIEQLIEETHG